MTSKRRVEKNKPRLTFRFGKLSFLLGLMLMVGAGAFAQTTPDVVGPDPDVPFDGGISLLVAAGVAYGAKQWHSSRKKEAQPEDAAGE